MRDLFLLAVRRSPVLQEENACIFWHKFRHISYRTSFVSRFNCNKKGYVQNLADFKIEGAKRYQNF